MSKSINELYIQFLRQCMECDKHIANCWKHIHAAEAIVERSEQKISADIDHVRLQREVLRSALEDCVRYMIDQGVSHEYAVMIRAKRALQYTEK